MPHSHHLSSRHRPGVLYYKGVPESVQTKALFHLIPTLVQITRKISHLTIHSDKGNADHVLFLPLHKTCHVLSVFLESYLIFFISASPPGREDEMEDSNGNSNGPYRSTSLGSSWEVMISWEVMSYDSFANSAGIGSDSRSQLKQVPNSKHNCVLIIHY